MNFTHEIDQIYFALRKLESAVNQQGEKSWVHIDKFAEAVEKAAKTLREEIKK